MFPAEERLQLLDSVDIYNRRTMDPHKFSGIELCFHGTQSLPHHSRAFAGMEMNVFVVRFYPVDLARVEESNPAVCFDNDTIQVRRLGFDRFKKRPYLQAPVSELLRMDALFYMFERRLQPHLVKWF